jgi:hypothetical protein
VSEVVTIIVNGAEGLYMADAAAKYPCSMRTLDRLRKLRGADGQPLLRTYPQTPGSRIRTTTYADLQACREKIAAMEAASLDEAIALLEAADEPHVETVAEELARLEREQEASSQTRRKGLRSWAQS